MAAGCQEDAPEARWVAEGRRTERGPAEVVQPRPDEVAGVSEAVLHRAARAWCGLAAAPRGGAARTGHFRLRRARRCSQRRRRAEGVSRSTAMSAWRDAVPFALAGRTLRRGDRSEEHTSELQSRLHLVCRLLLEKKKSQ